MLFAVGAQLVGRQREREVLGGLLNAARGGDGAALVVHGEPGVGKTALLDWTVEEGQQLRVLQTVGEGFLNYQVVAKREAEQRAELAASPEVVATVPYFDDDIHDLAGLLRLGDNIWR